jgi:hypothetical protein
MHLEQTGDTARGGHGAGPEVKHLACRAEVGLERERGGIRIAVQWCLGKEVVHARAARRWPYHGETTPARRGQHGFRQAGGKPAGKDRVEGIAAAPERVNGGLGRQWMAGCHCGSLEH